MFKIPREKKRRILIRIEVIEIGFSSLLTALRLSGGTCSRPLINVNTSRENLQQFLIVGYVLQRQ